MGDEYDYIVRGSNNPFSCYMVWWKEYKIFQVPNLENSSKKKSYIRKLLISDREQTTDANEIYINFYINFYSDPFMTNWPEIQWTDFTGCPQL